MCTHAKNGMQVREACSFLFCETQIVVVDQIYDVRLYLIINIRYSFYCSWCLSRPKSLLGAKWVDLGMSWPPCLRLWQPGKDFIVI